MGVTMVEDDRASVVDSAAGSEADGGEPAPSGGPDQVVMERVVDALKGVYDPEIPVDIWELGLIYRVDIDSGGKVEIDMTLTTPNCPVAEDMPERVKMMVEATEGIKSCDVNIVWEPPWRPDMMSEVAKVQLDMF